MAESYAPRMASPTAEIEASARRDDERRERRRRWSRGAMLAVGAAAAVALIIWTNWMLQRYYILGDDTARGEEFRAALLTGDDVPPNRESYVYTQCKLAAESLY